MPANSPNCIMMLPLNARRVTRNVWSTKKKMGFAT